MEPASITLGAIALLFPFYDACDRAYHGYSLTRAFGSDFLMVQFQLEMQWCRLDVTSRRRLIDLESPIQTDNIEHPHTQTVVKALSLIRDQFELSNRLMGKYLTEGDHTDGSLSVSSSSSMAFPLSQQPSILSGDTSLSSSTAIITPAPTPEGNLRKKVGVKRVGTKFKNVFSRPFRHSNSTHNGKLNATYTASKSSTASSSTAVDQQSSPSAALALLDEAVILASDQQQDNQRQSLKDNTTFARKVVWAHSDRETMRQSVKVLRELNTFLETVLVMKPTKDPMRLLLTHDPNNDDESWKTEAKVVQNTLMSLHDSLRHMNTPGNGHGMWKISVKLAANFQEARAGIANNLYGLKLRDQDEAYYFCLKRHLNEPQDTASLLVSESLPKDRPKEVTGKPKNTESSPAWHLDRPGGAPDNAGTFEEWGNVWTEAHPEDVHRLFLAPDHVSRQLDTLPGLLRHERAATMTPTQRADLAHLIAISYLHFSLVLPSCNEITPSSFTYHSNNEKDDAWGGEDLQILRPYLDFGFGQRPPPALWDGSGVSKTQSGLVVGLGLLLFQIGCCMTLPYNNSSQALEKGKRIAMSNLHLLDVRVSSDYAEITQACLQYGPAAARKQRGSADIFLEGVVSRLLDLQEGLA